MLKINALKLSLTLAVLGLSFGAIAQERVWGVQDGIVFHMNTDGSDFTKTFVANEIGITVGNNMTLWNNFIYGYMNDTKNIIEFNTITKELRAFYLEEFSLHLPNGGHQKIDFNVVADSGFIYTFGQHDHIPSVLKIDKTSGSVQVLCELPGYFSNALLGAVTDGGDGYLYGTYRAYELDPGIIFRVKKDGTNYSRLHTFVSPTYGLGKLIVSGEYLIGYTHGEPGNAGAGSVYQFPGMEMALLLCIIMTSPIHLLMMCFLHQQAHTTLRFT